MLEINKKRFKGNEFVTFKKTGTSGKWEPLIN